MKFLSDINLFFNTSVFAVKDLKKLDLNEDINAALVETPSENSVTNVCDIDSASRVSNKESSELKDQLSVNEVKREDENRKESPDLEEVDEKVSLAMLGKRKTVILNYQLWFSFNVLQSIYSETMITVNFVRNRRTNDLVRINERYAGGASYVYLWCH